MTYSLFYDDFCGQMSTCGFFAPQTRTTVGHSHCRGVGMENAAIRYWMRLRHKLATIRQLYIHHVSKTSLVWLAITLTQYKRILIFFGRNVTDKVDNQKMLYY